MKIVQTVEADAKAVVAEVTAALTYLKTEGEAAIAWVDSHVPGAQTAMAAFVKEAEGDAAVLARLAEQGLNDAIAAGAQDMETLLLNMIQASGLGRGGASGAALQALDVAGVNTLKAIGQGLVTTVITTIVGRLGAAALAAV